jgi:hypothetical protein
MPICVRPHCAIRSHHHDITFADFLKLSPYHCDLAKTKTSIDNKGFIDDFMFLSASWSGNTEIKKCVSIIRNRIAEIENEKCLISKRLRIIYLFSLVETHKIKIIRKMYNILDETIKNKHRQLDRELNI